MKFLEQDVELKHMAWTAVLGVAAFLAVSHLSLKDDVHAQDAAQAVKNCEIDKKLVLVESKMDVIPQIQSDLEWIKKELVEMHKDIKGR